MALSSRMNADFVLLELLLPYFNYRDSSKFKEIPR